MFKVRNADLSKMCLGHKFREVIVVKSQVLSSTRETMTEAIGHRRNIPSVLYLYIYRSSVKEISRRIFLKNSHGSGIPR